ncbi:polymorphic toxin type 15 domain-containing protein [Phyllobacterium sp. SB3]|uniref:polymorphic toxin type 15 domain-containing protein n=1 Tax=Phyllobacterium sp. SB3 TaxID=3156073 RepID=UPI0032AFD208
MDRQLKEQQDTINNMDPEKLADNIKNYKGRPAGDAAARRQTREDYRRTETRKLSEQYQAGGVKNFAEQAAKNVATKMADMNATHTLNLVAGGDGSLSGMGDASVNKSMGAQWNGGRSKQLLAHADEAKRKGKKMGVTLEECPPKGGKGSKEGMGGADTPAPGTGDPGPPPTS